MKIETLTLGPVGTNCYIVYNEGSEEAVVIDPAADESKGSNNASRNGSKSSKGKKGKGEQLTATEAQNAIEAAKRKAKEAVNHDYSFDLHLTDSSNQTVEELERDLLSGLDISDDDVDSESAGTAGTSGSSKSSQEGYKSNRKKNRKKKSAPVNDRYDDLLFEDFSDDSKDGKKGNNE